MNADDGYVTVGEAVRLTGKSEDCIRSYVANGILDAVRKGRRILVRAGSLERLWKECAHCGDSFVLSRNMAAEYCSIACRAAGRRDERRGW